MLTVEENILEFWDNIVNSSSIIKICFAVILSSILKLCNPILYSSAQKNF